MLFVYMKSDMFIYSIRVVAHERIRVPKEVRLVFWHSPYFGRFYWAQSFAMWINDKKKLVTLWNRPQKNSLSPNEWCIALSGSPHSWVELAIFYSIPKLMPSSILMMKIPYWMSRYVASFFLQFPKVTTGQHQWFRKLNWVWVGSANKSFGGDAHPRPTTLSNHLSIGKYSAITTIVGGGLCWQFFLVENLIQIFL
jgi:hypothetical protein